MDQRRRTTVNCRSSVETTQMTSKPGSDVAPGLGKATPAYGLCGVRHRDSASVIRALTLNCGNVYLERGIRSMGGLTWAEWLDVYHLANPPPPDLFDAPP